MKFTVQQSDLKRALFSVLLALPNKTTMPVLQNIRMQTEGNILSVCATDLQTTIIVSLQARVETQGVMLVEGKLFNDLIGSLPNQTVEIELLHSNKCYIVCGKSKNDIVTMSSDDYPYINSVCKNEFLLAEIKPEVFKQSLQQVTIASAKTDARPILSSVHFSFDKENENRFHMIATDGFRMSHKSETIHLLAEVSKSDFTVPLSLLENLQRLISTNTENVEIFCDENAIGFRIVSIDTETRIMGRQLDGQFPNIISHIPKEHTNNVCVDKIDLQKALRIAKLFAAKSHNILNISIGNNSISFSSSGDGKGTSVNEVDAVVEGNPMELSVNVVFLEEAVNVVSTDKIVLRTISAMKPITVREYEQDAFVHVIMPMQKK